MSSLLPSPPPSRSGASSPLVPDHPKESLISRLLITPLTFLSFILSLSLVSTHNHTLRTSLHSDPPSLSTRIKSFFHSLIYKRFSPITASPYAYIEEKPEGEDGGVGQGGVVGGVNREEGEWYYHTKQKKMMKAEMADAFRIRKWVLAVLVVGGGALAAVVMVGVCLFIGLGFRVWLREGVEEGF